MAAPGRWLIPALVLLLVPLWRFAPWVGLALAPLVLVAAWWQARWRPLQARQALVWVGGSALVIAALRVPGAWLWPCELACQAGKAFDSLLGIPLAWWAVGGSAAWLVAAWRGWAALVPLLGAMAGASLAFLVLLLRLDSLCGHCLAVHTAVLSGLLLAMAAPARWWLRLGPVIAVFGVVVAIHAGMPVTGPEPAPPAGGVLGAPPMAPMGPMP